jgi:ERCC4-related helicase
MCSNETNENIKYSHKPEIKVYLYEKQFEKSYFLLEVRLHLNLMFLKIFLFNKNKQKMDLVKDQFKSLEDLYKQRIDSNMQNNEVFLIEKNPFKDCKKYFSDLACILDELGYFAFYLSFRKLRDKMLRVFSEFQQNINLGDIKEYLEKLFAFINEFCNQVINGDELLGNKENSQKYSSPKVQCFLNILKEKHLSDCEASNENKFHAIVFVERKETALGFRDLMKKISELDEWKFIKCEYIIGHSNLKHGEKMDCKQQVLRIFEFYFDSRLVLSFK